jgi:hypothetical protein
MLSTRYPAVNPSVAPGHEFGCSICRTVSHKYEVCDYHGVDCEAYHVLGFDAM